MKFQLRTALWSLAIASLILLLLSERTRHKAEMESLKSEIEKLNERIEFGPRFADIEFFPPEGKNGSFDDTWTYKLISDTDE